MPDTADKLFIVYLRDGRTFPVEAATFARRINPDDEIKFLKSDGAELKDIFLRAPDTSAIAPDSPSVIPLPLVTLQNDVDLLKMRVDSLENSLADNIIRAVEAAFAKRGM